MNAYEIITKGGGILFLFLCLIQIAPIKINPWSAIAKRIGSAINQELMVKMEQFSGEMTQLHQNQKDFEENFKEDRASSCRNRILRFADELRRSEHHSEEFFNQILDDISDYERYCFDHPGYKNNRALAAIKKINTVYQRCLEEDSFL